MNYSGNISVVQVETASCSFGMAFKVPISIMFVTTFLLSVSENIGVSVVICADKKLRTPSNGYLLSLALTDILASLSIIPMEMTYVWYYPKWPLGSRGTDLENSFWLFSLVSPFLTLLAITVDRFKAVTSLVRYKEVASWKRTLVIVALLWVYCVLVVVLMGVFAFSSTTGETYEWNVDYKFYYAFLVIHIPLPLFIIFTLYFKIYRKAIENRQQLLSHGRVHSGSSSVPETAIRETRLEVKMAKTVGFVILFLVIVWIPVLVLEIFYAIGSESCIIEQLGVVSVWITCSNGMVNPIVYSIRNQNFRKSMWRLVRCKRLRSGSVQT